MGKLTLNILMSFAEFEREMIAERVRDKMRAARSKGKWTGGPVPFGFEVKDKKLVAAPGEAATVRTAFELFLEHQELPVVARLLNERGLLPAADSPTHRWNKAALRRIVRNPIYAGYCRVGEELAQGEHEAIVPQEAFRRAQEIIDGRAHACVARGRNDDYVLQGLLRCACGAALTPMGTRKAGQEYRYYRCSGRNKKGTDACGAKNLPAAELERLVANELLARAPSELPMEQIQRAILRRLEAKRLEMHDAKAMLPAQIAAASAKASQCLDELSGLEGRARQLGEQKLQLHVSRLEALEKRMADANAALKAMDAHQADAEWTARVLADLNRIWDVLSPQNRKRLLHALVDEIQVCDGKVTVRIAVLSEAEEAA